jgi:hypothetical protein
MMAKIFHTSDDVGVNSDLDDIRALRAAKVKEADAPAYALTAVRSELKI